MPESSQYDVRELENLALPFDTTTKELDPKPRLVDGSNMFVTTGGKLARRPGFTAYPGIPPLASSLSPVRLTVYRTVGDTHLCLVASCRDNLISSPETYHILTWRPADANWTASLAQWDSLGPHELIVVNGTLYHRCESIGIYSELYNGGALSTHALGTLQYGTWGFAKSPPAPTLVSSGSWPAAAVANVRVGWKYAYGYAKSGTDSHVSNRSKDVNTGAFTLKCPQISITPETDTLTYPSIVIYRTTDGGGLFVEIARTANPGVAFTFTDNIAGGNPIADRDLDMTKLAPDMVINSGPPARNYPTVYPAATEEHSNLAYFAGRIWYAVKNKLYFSGQEEIYAGVPLECFPDPNGVRGNWYLLPHEVVSVRATQDRLFIFTTDDIYVVIGEDRTNLRLLNFTRGLGMKSGLKIATAAHRETVFFVSKDWQIYAIVGDNPPVNISRDIAGTIRSLIYNGVEVQLVPWMRDGYTWLVVKIGSTLLVYDIDRNFWYTPWFLNFNSVGTITTGRLSLDDPQEHLIITGQDLGGSFEWRIRYLDFTATKDGDIPYEATFTTSLLDIPAGNHVNMLRQPAHHPMLSYLKMERTKFTGDTQPTVSYRLDEFSGTPTGVTATDPPFLLNQRSSYNTLWYPVQQVCQRTQVVVSHPAVNQKFEVQTLGLVFTPEAGA